MDHPTTVKILKFHAEKCNGCLECEKACSQVHFKTKDGGEKSAIRIIKTEKGYTMHVCDQRGLCLDMCPVGALTRRKNGVVWLDEEHLYRMSSLCWVLPDWCDEKSRCSYRTVQMYLLWVLCPCMS